MKPVEHIKSYCRFWKPSIARRITLYFLIFGLIIFFTTTFFYKRGAKRHFSGHRIVLVGYDEENIVF